VVWALLTRILKEASKAALAVSAALFFFFNFGALDDGVATLLKSDPGPSPPWLSALLLVGGLVLVVAVLRGLFRRAPGALRAATSFLNLFAILVVVAALAPLALETSWLRSGKLPRMLRPGEEEGGLAGQALETTPNPTRCPDIYY